MKKIWCVVAAVALLGTAAFEFVSREGESMAEIKKKSAFEQSSRMVDRTVDAGKRMKDIALKTRDAVQKNENQENRSPSAYASGRTTDAAKLAAGKAAQQFHQRGRKSVKTTQENMKKAADAVQHFKTQQAAKAAQKQKAQEAAQTVKAAQKQQVRETVQTAKAASQQTARQTIPQHSTRQAVSSNKEAASFGQTAEDILKQPVSGRIRFSGSEGMTSNRIVNRARSPSGRSSVRTVGRPGNMRAAMMATGRQLKTAGVSAYSSGQAAFTTGQAMQRTIATSRQTMQTVSHTIRNASDYVRAIASATASAFRITVGSTKALLTALLAGAWLSVMIIVAIALFGGAMSITGGTNGSVYTEVSAAVQAYEPIIRQYAIQYGIPEYVELIKAVMMQESGGEGGDPMQAAEGPYNTRYPRVSNGITDPEYSISCGVQELKNCMERAGVQSPVDIEHISLALQGYNFGNGYISWAISHYGGYSATNAQEFSNMQARAHGWISYGDPEYVPHVLRYYPFGRVSTGGNQAIVEIAIAQVGNRGGQKFWSWYGFRSHVQWCACFVSWCANECGYIDSGVVPKHAACQNGADWFKNHNQWQPRSYVPSSGDIIYFDWNGDGHTEHVGIVEKVENGTVYTVEGNASNTCAQRHYPVGSSKIYGYGIPAY